MPYNVLALGEGVKKYELSSIGKVELFRDENVPAFT
jgi:hypothetical protein